MTPLLCAVVLAYAGSRVPLARGTWPRLALVTAAAALGFAGLMAFAGVSAVPAAGRYQLTVGIHTVRHLAVLLAHVAIWLAIPMLRRGAAGRGSSRDAILLATGWAVASVLPTLLLTWQSPGHLYLALFGTALAAGPVWADRAEGSRIADAALPAIAVLVFAAAAGFAVSRGLLRWGPITRQVLTDWQALRQPGDRRVVIFDADNAAWHQGLARLLGPGIRLREALKLVSREPLADATICIDLVEGPPYAPQQGDALFLNSGGRLRRVPAAPFRAYCLPSDPAVPSR
jgi:hypothetical protein